MRLCADCGEAEARNARSVYCQKCVSSRYRCARRAGKRGPGAPVLSNTPDAVRQRRTKGPSKASEPSHWRNVKSKYGITEEEYEAILVSQGGVCAICKRPPAAFSKRLCIDHLHSSTMSEKYGNRATVRGVVCWRDNYHLIHKGITPADLRAAADYLEQWPARAVLTDVDAPTPMSDGDYRTAQRLPHEPGGTAGLVE